MSGRVTLDGQPLPGARIRFQPEAPEGSPSYGTTDQNGYYELGYKRGVEGARIGWHTVRIDSDDFTRPDGQIVRAKSLPARYNLKTELRAEVKANSTNEINFELTSGAK